MRDQIFLIERISLNPHRVSRVALISVVFCLLGRSRNIEAEVSNAHCSVVAAYNCRKCATQPRHHPANIHTLDILRSRSCEWFSLSPQDAKLHVPDSQENAFLSRVHPIHKRRCFSVVAYSTEVSSWWSRQHSNFAKAEDISGTANEENQRSCMSKKEEIHAKRRIDALHISILVQPDDYLSVGVT